MMRDFENKTHYTFNWPSDLFYDASYTFMCTVIIFLIIKIPPIMNQIVYFSVSNQIRQTGPAIRDICIFL